ncbi:MAG TPA: hypothetical protein EYQ69_00195 [Gemmatimonadetes bacterium]|nr:hypothetical protein [Gemmatimonadota bacterium]
MTFSFRCICVVLALLTVGRPSLSQAQGRPPLSSSRSVSLSGGILRYALEAEGKSTALIALSTDYENSDRTRIEFGATYSKPEVTSPVEESVQGSTIFSHIATMTAGVQASFPMGFLQPYLGISGGLFVRRDENPQGVRYWKSTISVPLGVRVQILGSVGLRGEYRVRRDQHEFFPHTSSEFTAGIYWIF